MENMYTKKWKHLNMSFSEVKNAKKKNKKKLFTDIAGRRTISITIGQLTRVLLK